jgi:transposase
MCCACRRRCRSANVKLASVATDVLGKSGRAMLEALVGGEQDPEALAALARGRLRAKLPELRQALEGRMRPVHLVQLRLLLEHITFLESALAELQHKIEHLLSPFAEAVALAQTVPGVAQNAAIAIIAPDWHGYASLPLGQKPRRLASWAGVCPGNKQSAGKRLSGHTTSGNGWLRAVLGEVAWAISHTSDNYLSAQFHRLARRRGKQIAVLAVAHSVLVILYHLLRDHQPSADLGADYFEQLDRTHLERRYVRHLERLGYAVTLTPSAT